MPGPTRDQLIDAIRFRISDPWSYITRLIVFCLPRQWNLAFWLAELQEILGENYRLWPTEVLHAIFLLVDRFEDDIEFVCMLLRIASEYPRRPWGFEREFAIADQFCAVSRAQGVSPHLWLGRASPGNGKKRNADGKPHKETFKRPRLTRPKLEETVDKGVKPPPRLPFELPEFFSAASLLEPVSDPESDMDYGAEEYDSGIEDFEMDDSDVEEQVTRRRKREDSFLTRGDMSEEFDEPGRLPDDFYDEAPPATQE